MTGHNGPVQKPISRYRNYWTYSAGLAVAWAIIITIRLLIGVDTTFHAVLLIFGGFVVGWITTTIARYVYPPPRRWQERYRQTT